MRYLKSFGRWLTFLIFHIGILFLITTASLMIMLGDRQSLKAVLNESKVYDSLVDSFLETAANESADEPDALPFNDVRLREIANDSFSPIVLRASSEHIIDETYDWLNGEKDELKFTVNFEAQSKQFIDGLSNYAVERFEGLPPCSAVDRVDVTVFRLTCQPAGATPDIVRQASYDDLSQVEFISNPVITSEDLINEQEKKEIEFLPEAYRSTRIIPFIAIVIIIASGIAFVLLHRSRRKGFKRLGRDMLSSALFISLLTLVFGFLLPRYTDTFSVQGEGLPRLFNNIIDAFLQNLDIIVINIAIVLGSVGLTILLLERMSRPENLYADVAKKAGLSTSTPKSSKNSSTKQNNKPPVQTSETKRKSKKSTRKTKKYRKIGL